MLLDHIPVHDLKEDDFFIIETIEDCEKQSFKDVHRHNFHEILFFTGVGQGDEQRIDFVRYPLQANQIYLLRCGQVHKMKLQNQQGYLFAISPQYFDRMDSSIGYDFPPVITLHEEDILPARQLAALILHEFNGKRRYSLLQSYMNAFILLLLLSYRNIGQTTGIDNRVKQLLLLVDKHFIHERSAAFYAGQISLSAKRLNDLTKQALGKTITQLIHERLLLEARRLICHGELSFKEISFSLGFKDSSYFTRFFREQSGTTPEQFRQSL